ncbi:MAG TPA: hypothetical protein VGJ28_09585 [Micromonosporaceae bacterium]
MTPPPYEFYISSQGRDAIDVLRRNDVLEDEVAQVLDSQHRLPLPMVADYGSRTLAILGRTRSGRALRVDVRLAAGFRRIIVGARDMSDDELAHYEKWVGSDEQPD